MTETLLASILYVINAQGFYTAMGLTTATSIFVGAAFYNGEIRAMWKGAIAIGSYAGLLLITTLARVLERIDGKVLSPEQSGMAYAGSVTALFLALYYILGMIIGVYTVKRIKKGRH
ncbi:MAG: hypothetical protein IFNCLDLE_02620 [Ignavibacteriaceae bacterium]|nr:hypothetical protein [Ignavibacteriaceae bacterium]